MIPTSVKEVENLGWDYIDVILFSGDAFIDHPSFGTAVIARYLQKHGYRVAVVPQPNWRDDLRDFRKLGRPRLYFGVNSGAMDSMVNHYTASKRLRSNDAYTPMGKAGARPDYATSVYTKIPILPRLSSIPISKVTPVQQIDAFRAQLEQSLQVNPSSPPKSSNKFHPYHHENHTHLVSGVICHVYEFTVGAGLSVADQIHDALRQRQRLHRQDGRQNGFRQLLPGKVPISHHESLTGRKVHSPN